MTAKNNHKAGLSAGIAAAAAAAAIGAYFLYGRHGEKNRKKVKGWMLKARGEILEKLEKLDQVSEDSYSKIVQGVAANYKGARNVTASELSELVSDAKKHWKALRPMFQSGPGAKTADSPRRKKVRRKQSKSSE